MKQEVKDAFKALLHCPFINTGVEQSNMELLGHGLARVYYCEYFTEKPTPNEIEASGKLDNLFDTYDGTDSDEFIFLFLLWLSNNGVDIPEEWLNGSKTIIGRLVSDEPEGVFTADYPPSKSDYQYFVEED